MNNAIEAASRLSESLDAIAFILNKEGEIIKVNERGRKILGFINKDDEEKLTNQYMIDLMDDYEKERMTKAFKKTITYKNSSAVISTINKKNGESITVRWFGSIIKNGGPVEGLLVLGHVLKEDLHIRVDENNNIIISMCSCCKKIHDAESLSDKQWKVLDDYLLSKSNIRFSHGICPSCAQQFYGRYIQGDNVNIAST